jgi:hypothetical protein
MLKSGKMGCKDSFKYPKYDTCVKMREVFVIGSFLTKTSLGFSKSSPVGHKMILNLTTKLSFV